LRDAETVGLGIGSWTAWPVVSMPDWCPPACLHSLMALPKIIHIKYKKKKKTNTCSDQTKGVSFAK
jgi:hypothetical protein